MKPALDRRDLARFRDLIRARTGMAFPGVRGSQLEWAVQRAAADTDKPGPDALYESLVGRKDSHDGLDALICALSVSETHFFRDAGQIRALEQRILPDLISRRRHERRLRLWSAGCSTGEEAYTLAILVKRLLIDLADWDVLILATDINGRSLERARRGVYGAWSLRGMPTTAVTEYLAPVGSSFEVTASIRAMVSFAQLNLADDIYPSVATSTRAMDIVLCRNVLLYFDEEGGRALVGRLREALGEDGLLLVSQVEAGLGVFDGLTQEAPGTAIYGKKPPKPATTDVGQGEPVAIRDRCEPAGTLPIPGRRRPELPLPRRSHAAHDPRRTHGEVLELWKAGLAEPALRRLETMTKSCPLEASLHYLYGLILIDAKRMDEALAAFRRCTYSDPEFALGHLAQASLLARMGFLGRALAPLETAARLMAVLEPDAVLLEGEGLTVGDVLELIASERELLAGSDAKGASRG